MSARAKATTSARTSFCASPSPSARLQAPFPSRSAERLANRPGTQQPRQKADPGEQRVAALPRLELDLRARVAVDLPCDVFGAAGEGEAGLGEAQDRQALSFYPAPTP